MKEKKEKVKKDGYPWWYPFFIVPLHALIKGCSPWVG